MLRARKNKVAREHARNAMLRGGGRPDSWKARKIGGSSVPDAKNLRKIRGFELLLPLHPHALPLSIDYVQGLDSLEYRG